MPPPVDYRDLPYLWQAGYFAMEPDKLKSRLRSSKLMLGPVEETIQHFCSQENPPPIGFISFDLDYYSSTMAAFKIFAAAPRHLLPRIACYFDDMVGDIDWAYNDFTGELLAIREFNAANDDMKLAPVQGLRFYGSRLPRAWHEQIFVAQSVQASGLLPTDLRSDRVTPRGGVVLRRPREFLANRCPQDQANRLRMATHGHSVLTPAHVG